MLQPFFSCLKNVKKEEESLCCEMLSGNRTMFCKEIWWGWEMATAYGWASHNIHFVHSFLFSWGFVVDLKPLESTWEVKIFLIVTWFFLVKNMLCYVTCFVKYFSVFRFLYNREWSKKMICIERSLFFLIA